MIFLVLIYKYDNDNTPFMFYSCRINGVATATKFRYIFNFTLEQCKDGLMTKLMIKLIVRHSLFLVTIKCVI